MLLANGASGVRRSTRRATARSSTRCARCRRELALGIVRGGEGATKLVTVTVTGAASAAEARRAAKAIANSLLVKTAIHGGDPNWGRLIAVAGRAGVAFELSRAAVTIGSIVLFKDGQPYDEAAPEAAEYLKGTDIAVIGRSRRRARACVDGVDVRSQRRVRADQRGVPDSEPTMACMIAHADADRARTSCRSSTSTPPTSSAASSWPRS